MACGWGGARGRSARQVPPALRYATVTRHFVRLFTCAAVLLVTGAAIAAQGRGPRVVRVPDAPVLDFQQSTPLTLPPGRTFGAVVSVAVNSKGHIFIYQRTAQPVIEFDAQGRYLRDLREGTDVRAHSIQIDRDGNIWTVDAVDQTVTKLDSNGQVLMTIGTKGVTGNGDEDARASRLNAPADVAFAPNGDIIVVQGENGAPDPRVIRYDANGRFVTTWSLAYDATPRSSPHAVVVTADGLIHVADRDIMKIRVFRPDGTPVRELQMPNRVYGLALDRAGQPWMATGNDGMVFRIDWDGRILGRMGTAGRTPGLLAEAHLLTVAPNGDVYVADPINQIVHRFAPAATR
jgi:peptidylamidoglycolate lyase